MGKHRSLFAGQGRLCLTPGHQREEADPVSLLEDGFQFRMDPVDKNNLDLVRRYSEPTDKLANRGALGEFYQGGAPVPVRAEFG